MQEKGETEATKMTMGILDNIINLYDSFVNFYIEHFRSISIILTLLVCLIVIIYKKVKGNQDLGLGSIVSLILSSYSIPTAFLLIICCTDISKLENIAEISIYLIISGIALFHTACSFINKYGK